MPDWSGKCAAGIAAMLNPLSTRETLIDKL
jgi:hypothetical protein